MRKYIGSVLCMVSIIMFLIIFLFSGCNAFFGKINLLYHNIPVKFKVPLSFPADSDFSILRQQDLSSDTCLLYIEGKVASWRILARKSRPEFIYIYRIKGNECKYWRYENGNLRRSNEKEIHRIRNKVLNESFRFLKEKDVRLENMD